MPPSSLSATSESPSTSPTSHPTTDRQDDTDSVVHHPSSAANLGPPRKPKVPKGMKKKGKQLDEHGGPCYLLSIPGDVLHLLLSRLPPRSLLNISATCKLLHTELKSDTFWRHCYINHFLWDGAASDSIAREEVRVLVQGCMGIGGRGWRREALSREGMLERWVGSRTSSVNHVPVNVVVAALSLSYPPQLGLPKTTPLVVGKMTGGSRSPMTPEGSPAATPTKMSHRQKYETMLAVSSRSAPTLYSVGLDNSALVKSDPLTGKVSKGFWGPGMDANFHLRPHWDPSSAPVAVHIPKRSQSHMLWGQLTGSVVHTTMSTRSHSTHGGRANSINVYCKSNDTHIGAVTAIQQPEGETLKWVTGGEDGVVKYWQLTPGSGRSGKRSPTEQPASMTCVFVSNPVEEAPLNRSEEIRLRHTLRPDPIAVVACDTQYDVVAGCTEDGDLRVWFDITAEPHEVRIDVGSKEEFGGVKHLYLSCAERDGRIVASVLVHHHKHPALSRYDISVQGDEHHIDTTFYTTPGEVPLTALFVSLDTSPAIAAPPQVESTLSARIVTPASGAESGNNTPPELPIEDLPRRLADTKYGRFLVAGDEAGQAYIWSWDGRPVHDRITPMRSWVAAEGKVTALDFYCGLVAVGSYDGHYAVFDPLPHHVERLRAFRPPSHYTPGDLQLAASDESRARYYTVNHLVLDNDLVVAAIGRNVQTWRSGTGKGRQSGKDAAVSRKGGGKGDRDRGHGYSRQIDLRDLHHDAVESHYEIQAENEIERVSVSHEQQHRAAMEDLGLEDGDAALQYALMLSQQEADAAAASSPVLTPHEDGEMSDDEAEAIRAVEAFQAAERAEERAEEQAEEDDLAEILEMIRIAEAKERAQQG